MKLAKGGRAAQKALSPATPMHMGVFEKGSWVLKGKVVETREFAMHLAYLRKYPHLPELQSGARDHSW